MNNFTRFCGRGKNYGVGCVKALSQAVFGVKERRQTYTETIDTILVRNIDDVMKGMI